MPYLLYPAALILGFIALIVGANIFVDGSSFVARKLRIPPLIIGLTIVALGTSAPELAVSITSAAHGANELAFSNVVGSNIFNLLAVLGVCALISPVPVERDVTRRDLPAFILVCTALFLYAGGTGFLGYRDMRMSETVGTVGRLAGALLLAGFLIYTIILIICAKKRKLEGEIKIKPGLSTFKSIIFILAGVALIIGGGQAVVYGARKLASSFGVSETLIGLTIVAVGTSLPELVTSIVAALKGETELAVGNAVGSSILNIMLILGASALIDPIGVSLASLCDMLLMIVAGILTLIFAITAKRIRRLEGAMMLAAYAASLVFAFARG